MAASRRRPANAWILCLLACLGGSVRGGDVEPGPAQGGLLPPVLVKLPDGPITAADFRAALRDRATVNPQRFQLGESFLRHTLIVMEAVRQEIPTPADAQVRARSAQQAAGVAGALSFEEQLAQAGLTRGDLQRYWREGLLLEATARKQLGQPAPLPLETADLGRIYEGLWKQYAPAFYGLGAGERAATVGGVNFSPDEVVDYLVQWGGDRALAEVLDQLVCTRGIFREASARGLDTIGLNPEHVLAGLLAPELTVAKLQAYYEAARPALALVRAAHIFCAFDPDPGQAYRVKAVAPEARTRARMRAEEIHQLLRSGKLDFAEAARKHSDCASASEGGDLGYLAPGLDVSLNLPPQAYALDFLRTPQGLRSPIVAPPDPAILETARKLADGGIAAPLETRTGYSIVRRIECRLPRNFDTLQTYLRRRRFLELRDAFLERLRHQGAEYCWRPQDRLPAEPAE